MDTDKIMLKGKWLNTSYKGSQQITNWHIFNALFKLKIGSWVTKIYKCINHKMELSVLGSSECPLGFRGHVLLGTVFEVSNASTLTINGLNMSNQDI